MDQAAPSPVSSQRKSRVVNLFLDKILKAVKKLFRGSREDEPGASFDEVLSEEWVEIAQRRSNAKCQVGEKPTQPNLVGVAFSGGGIRSATTCLGALQGLQNLRLLRIF